MDTQNKNLIVSPWSHIKTVESTKRIMYSVILALLPAGIAGIYIFGIKTLYIMCISIITAIITEAAIELLRKKQVTISDGTAFITGLLLAYNLPPNVPLWLPAVGAAFGIIIGKQAFGGLGFNIFNPALIGRVFLMTSWPVYMTNWSLPRWQPDTLSTATPLAILKQKYSLPVAGYWDLLIGNRGGCIGEVCIFALLLGAAFLLIRGYIWWHTPFTYIISVGILSWVFLGKNGLFSGDGLFYILTGGLVLGAFFMATDYVTGPLTAKGQIIFGLGCGIITFAIRKWAGYPEGVSYSILIMNAATPIIDRHTRPRTLGSKK